MPGLLIRLMANGHVMFPQVFSSSAGLLSLWFTPPELCVNPATSLPTWWAQWHGWVTWTALSTQLSTPSSTPNSGNSSEDFYPAAAADIHHKWCWRGLYSWTQLYWFILWFRSCQYYVCLCLQCTASIFYILYSELSFQYNRYSQWCLPGTFLHFKTRHAMLLNKPQSEFSLSGPLKFWSSRMIGLHPSKTRKTQFYLKIHWRSILYSQCLRVLFASKPRHIYSQTKNYSDTFNVAHIITVYLL